MINKIVLVGRTTKTIELKQSKNGTPYITFTLAVNRPFKCEQGSQQADFINCIAWNKTAETVAQYVSKGMLIGIEGRLQVRGYENEAGTHQYLSEVLVNHLTFLESKKSYVVPELVEPFTNQQSSAMESSMNYNKVIQNYDNPFATATTLAGGLTTHKNTRIVDEDLPF